MVYVYKLCCTIKQKVVFAELFCIYYIIFANINERNVVCECFFVHLSCFDVKTAAPILMKFGTLLNLDLNKKYCLLRN